VARRIAARPPAPLSGGEAIQPWAGPSGLPRAYLVDFIYTSCPGVCQVLGGEFARMQAALQEASPEPTVRLMSVSFDIQRDNTTARRRSCSWRGSRAHPRVPPEHSRCV